MRPRSGTSRGQRKWLVFTQYALWMWISRSYCLMNIGMLSTRDCVARVVGLLTQVAYFLGMCVVDHLCTLACPFADWRSRPTVSCGLFCFCRHTSGSVFSSIYKPHVHIRRRSNLRRQTLFDRGTERQRGRERQREQEVMDDKMKLFHLRQRRRSQSRGAMHMRRKGQRRYGTLSGIKVT